MQRLRLFSVLLGSGLWKIIRIPTEGDSAAFKIVFVELVGNNSWNYRANPARMRHKRFIRSDVRIHK